MEVGRRALDISFRAIDAYRKTLLIDKVTSNDDQSPPVYLLNELSDILRSCSSDLTQEIVEYAFRRLRHQNPQVKYKVLRLIKYTVSRAGSAVYRNELQRYSASIRELFNFQGQVDPFKGNALNQAVRDAAHEAIKAIFSYDSSQHTSKNIHDRIEGFGNGNFSEHVGSSYGSALFEETQRDSLRHHGGNGQFDNMAWIEGFGNGNFSEHVGSSYRSALVKETERDSLQHRGNGHFDNMGWKQGYESEPQEIENDQPKSDSEKVSSPEEQLLHKITASQGLRLQPTHGSLQFFLSTAKKLDAVRIALALEAKLRSPSWQVQLKALCFLQALLHHKDASLLQAIRADEEVFDGCVQECLLSPQTTLRKKAKEVLESLRALKKAKDPNGSPKMLADNALRKIQSRDMDFFMLEPNQSNDGDPSFVSPLPAAPHTDQVFDLLSLQNDDFAEFQAAETSPNSVMDDPFQGLCIFGPKESHVEDLLTGEYMDYSVHSVEPPFGKATNRQNYASSGVALQSNVVNNNWLKTPTLNNITMPDMSVDGFTTTRKSALSSLDSKSFSADSKGNNPGFQNLNAVYMFPSGNVGSSHNIAALQGPGGTPYFNP